MMRSGISRRLSASLCSLLLFPCLFSEAAVPPGEHDLRIRMKHPGGLRIMPGEVLSLGFLLSNRSSRKITLKEKLILPDKWRTLLPPGQLEISPRATRTRIQLIQIPAQTEAGLYELAYQSVSCFGTAYSSRFQFHVEILPRARISLLPESSPRQVKAGEIYRVNSRILNLGNTGLNLKLRAHSTRGYQLKIFPAAVSLEPGEESPVRITVKTNSLEKQETESLILVTADLPNRKGNRVESRITAKTLVLPRGGARPDHSSGFPLETTLAFGKFKERNFSQVEISGRSGSGKGGKPRYEFRIRGPDQQELAPLGRMDEYRFKYSSRNLRIVLGDQASSLSRLTSWARYGRGAGVDLRLPGGRGAIGGFWQKDLRWGRNSFTRAYYASFSPGDRFHGRINFLNAGRSDDGHSNSGSGKILSLESRVLVGDELKLEAEYARSPARRQSRTSGQAYRIRGEGKIARSLSYRINRVHASPGYSGYYQGMASSSLSLIYPVSSSFRISSSFLEIKKNPPERNPGSSMRHWRINLDCMPYRFWTLGLNGSRVQRTDRLPHPGSSFRQDLLGIRLGLRFKNWGTQAEIRRGNQGVPGQSSFRRQFNYRLSLSFQPRRMISAGFYHRIGTWIPSTPQDLIRRRNESGIRMNFSPLPGIDMNLNLSRYNLADGRRPLTHYRYRLRLGLPGSHLLTLELRNHSGFHQGGGLSLLMAYSIPFTLPAGFESKGKSTVQGRIRETSESGTRGIADAAVRINAQTAFTDDEGRFIFSNLETGRFHLWVDQDSIPPGLIITRQMPVTGFAAAGKTVRFELEAVPVSRIRGRLVIESPRKPGKGDKPFPGRICQAKLGDGEHGIGEIDLSGIMVEISNGIETRKTLTSPTGQFRFEHLQPGFWRLKISSAGIPRFHYLENPFRKLELEPGLTGRVKVRILPKAGSIIFIDQGTIGPTSSN